MTPDIEAIVARLHIDCGATNHEWATCTDPDVVALRNALTAASTDDNGCHTRPDGECVSEGPCIHTSLEDAYRETAGRLLAERDGANERARLLLDAKNHWLERARAAEARLTSLWPALYNHKPNPLVAHLGCDLCPLIEELRWLYECDDCHRSDGTHDPDVEH